MILKRWDHYILLGERVLILDSLWFDYGGEERVVISFDIVEDLDCGPEEYKYKHY